MRKKGSCKFETYWKVETWNPIALCWSPIQKTYPSKKEAEDSATGKFRILEISESGIKIL